MLMLMVLLPPRYDDFSPFYFLMFIVISLFATRLFRFLAIYSAILPPFSLIR